MILYVENCVFLLLYNCWKFVWFSSEIVLKREVASSCVEKGHQRSTDLVTSSPSRGRVKGRPRFADGKDVSHSTTSSPCKNPRKLNKETEVQTARRGSLIVTRQDAARSSSRVDGRCSSGARQKLDFRADEFETKPREAAQSKRPAPPEQQWNLSRSKAHSRSRENNLCSDLEENKLRLRAETDSNTNFSADGSGDGRYWSSRSDKIVSEYSIGSSKLHDYFGSLERDYDSDNGNPTRDCFVKIGLDEGPLKSRSKARRFKRVGSFGNPVDGSPLKKVDANLPFREVTEQVNAPSVNITLSCS